MAIQSVDVRRMTGTSCPVNEVTVRELLEFSAPGPHEALASRGREWMLDWRELAAAYLALLDDRTARDAAIRAEEREACARLAESSGALSGRVIGEEIRGTRASSSATQPETPPYLHHGDDGVVGSR